MLNRERNSSRGPISPCSLEEFEIMPGAVVAMRLLHEAGLLVLATTNQPGLSRGTLSRCDLDMMHRSLMKGVLLDDILVCPHDADDHCPCRKPKAGLLVEAGFRHHADLEHSFVISHKWQDAAAAHVAGCISVLVESPWNGSGHHDFIVPTLEEAVNRVLQLHHQNQFGCQDWEAVRT
jgi:D-glycero-D-manno-heptose 1,7-bisphosphate phosphatase